MPASPEGREPLSLRWLAPAPDDPWRRFECSSRGDRIEARLAIPDAPGPHPLALWAGDDGPAFPATALALAGLDLPLLGGRRTPKWTERLRACLARGPERPSDRILLEAFVDQAVGDLQRVLDVCAARPEIDAARMGFVGIGPGALVGARLREREPRLCAFVLSPAGLAGTLDPEAELAGEAPCFLLGDDPRCAAWAAAGGAAMRARPGPGRDAALACLHEALAPG